MTSHIPLPTRRLLDSLVTSTTRLPLPQSAPPVSIPASPAASDDFLSRSTGRKNSDLFEVSPGSRFHDESQLSFSGLLGKDSSDDLLNDEPMPSFLADGTFFGTGTDLPDICIVNPADSEEALEVGVAVTPDPMIVEVADTPLTISVLSPLPSLSDVFDSPSVPPPDSPKRLNIANPSPMLVPAAHDTVAPTRGPSKSRVSLSHPLTQEQAVTHVDTVEPAPTMASSDKRTLTVSPAPVTNTQSARGDSRRASAARTSALNAIVEELSTEAKAPLSRDQAPPVAIDSDAGDLRMSLATYRSSVSSETAAVVKSTSRRRSNSFLPPLQGQSINTLSSEATKDVPLARPSFPSTPAAPQHAAPPTAALLESANHQLSSALPSLSATDELDARCTASSESMPQLAIPAHILPNDHPAHRRASAVPPLTSIEDTSKRFPHLSLSTIAVEEPATVLSRSIHRRISSTLLPKLPPTVEVSEDEPDSRRTLSLVERRTLAPPPFSPILPAIHASPRHGGNSWGGDRMTSTPRAGWHVAFALPDMSVEVVPEEDASINSVLEDQTKRARRASFAPPVVEVDSPERRSGELPAARRVPRLSTSVFVPGGGFSSTEGMAPPPPPAAARRATRLPADPVPVLETLIERSYSPPHSSIAVTTSSAPSAPGLPSSSLPTSDVTRGPATGVVLVEVAPIALAARRASIVQVVVKPVPPRPPLPLKASLKTVGPNRAIAPMPPRAREKEPKPKVPPGGLTVPRDFMSHGAQRDAERNKRIEQREKERIEKENIVKKRQLAALGKSQSLKRPKLASSFQPDIVRKPRSRPPRRLSTPLTKDALEASASMEGPKLDLERRVSSYLEGILTGVPEVEEGANEMLEPPAPPPDLNGQAPAPAPSPIVNTRHEPQKAKRAEKLEPVPRVENFRPALSVRNTQNQNRSAPAKAAAVPSKTSVVVPFTFSTTSKRVAPKSPITTSAMFSQRLSSWKAREKAVVPHETRDEEARKRFKPNLASVTAETVEKETWEARQRRREEENRRTKEERRKKEEEEEMVKLKQLRASLGTVKANPLPAFMVKARRAQATKLATVSNTR